MSFSSLSLTDAGANLLSKVAAGGALQFNRVAIGSGAWAGGVFNPAMTALVGEQISLGIQALVATGAGTARLTTIMLFADLIATGFDATEIGIFAEDPDDGEILFAAAQDADPSPIPANTAVPAYEHVYNCAISIGNATSLTVEVDSSIATATLQDLDDHASATAVHEASSSAVASRLIIRDASGRAQIAAPVAPADIARKADVDAIITFPSGTIMLFGQSSAPVGWTRKTDWADKAMLCYAAAGNIGAGGSADPRAAHTHTGPSHTHAGPNHYHSVAAHTHLTSPHALTVAEMPSHAHSLPGGFYGQQSGGYEYQTEITGTGGSLISATNATGGGAAHDHGATASGGSANTTNAGTDQTGASGTGATGGNAAPKYQEVIAATKD